MSYLRRGYLGFAMFGEQIIEGLARRSWIVVSRSAARIRSCFFTAVPPVSLRETSLFLEARLHVRAASGCWPGAKSRRDRRRRVSMQVPKICGAESGHVPPLVVFTRALVRLVVDNNIEK